MCSATVFFLGGYPIGVVIAPIMLIEDWQLHYTQFSSIIVPSLLPNISIDFMGTLGSLFLLVFVYWYKM